MSEIEQKIQTEIETHRVLVFMKGSKLMPLCGFSGRLVDILNGYGIDYETRDVLKDDSLRQGLKRFSNWPTFPQLYVNGEFIGGCDIVSQLHEEGKLSALLKEG